VTGSAEARCVLFVYGSLKRGHANHQQLAGARFIGVARTARAFALREIDGYPALVPGERAIAGELYELSLPSLSALDEFEGDGYKREEIELADGAVAIAYLARSPRAGTPLSASEWPKPRSD
jgi:gamma-glutamylaminecyclotransferase